MNHCSGAWDRGKYSYPMHEGAALSIVHNSTHDERSFVHDTMLCEYQGKMYMAWYSCPKAKLQRIQKLSDEAQRITEKTGVTPL